MLSSLSSKNRAPGRVEVLNFVTHRTQTFRDKYARLSQEGLDNVRVKWTHTNLCHRFRSRIVSKCPGISLRCCDHSEHRRSVGKHQAGKEPEKSPRPDNLWNVYCMLCCPRDLGATMGASFCGSGLRSLRAPTVATALPVFTARYSLQVHDLPWREATDFRGIDGAEIVA